MERWDEYFLNLAEFVSTNSQCLSRKIGAVIVRDKSILSTGYNGPPRGIARCDTRYGFDKLLDRYASRTNDPPPSGTAEVCPRQAVGFKSSELLDLCPAAHAEANAIANAARVGVSLVGSTLYVNCEVPCKNCLSLIINSGIREVVCRELRFYDELSEYILRNSVLLIREPRRALP